MDKIIISPSKYVQGENALNCIGQYVKPLGQKALVIADDFVTGLVGTQVTASFAEAEGQLVLEKFNGECSRQEIDRLIELAKTNKSEVIIGIGVGKTLDTAKAIAFYHNVPVVVVPTIASTDAPTSALAVIYTPEGEFSEYLMIPSNPNMVIMDTKIIAGAPA